MDTAREATSDAIWCGKQDVLRGLSTGQGRKTGRWPRPQAGRSMAQQGCMQRVFIAACIHFNISDSVSSNMRQASQLAVKVVRGGRKHTWGCRRHASPRPRDQTVCNGYLVVQVCRQTRLKWRGCGSQLRRLRVPTAAAAVPARQNGPSEVLQEGQQQQQPSQQQQNQEPPSQRLELQEQQVRRVPEQCCLTAPAPVFRQRPLDLCRSIPCYQAFALRNPALS